MSRLWNTRWAHYALLSFAAGVMFFLNLGGATLWDLDEGRNATAALEMRESGDWVRPTFNAQLRVDKPALLYWCQVAAYHCFGVNEFAARLPSALAALAVVLLCYELARSMFGAHTGLIAGLVVATTPMLCGAARFANPDSLLNCFTVLTLALFWWGQGNPRTLWYLSMGCAAGLGVLAKGPVGIVLPGAVIVAFLIWEKRFSLLLDWRMALAALACILVALPWYVLVAVDTRADFLERFIMQHNVGRFLSTMENHHGSLAYYPLVFLVGLAPWTVFIGMTSWCTIWSMIRTPWTRFRETWSKAADRATGGEASTYRFLAAWLGLYLVFFSAAATKLPNYVLPAAVPCAVLTARFLERWRHGSLSVPAWAMPTSLLCLAAIGVASGIGMAIASGLWPLPLVRGRYIPGLAHWTFLGLVPVATALAAAWLLRRRKRSALLACLVVGAVAFLAPLAAWSSAAFNQVKATRGLVEQAQALQPTRDIRVGCWRLEHLPSLNFYVQRDVIHHKSQAQALAFLRCHVPVFLFLPAEDWETMRHQAPPGWRERGRHPDFYHHTEVVVISNR